MANKISSLEDMASAQVAINLCQKNSFKEVALRLEKPTYGGFIAYDPSQFVSDPEELLIWTKIKKNDWLLEAFEETCYPSNVEKARRWDAAVDEQCQRLIEGIPYSLRQGVHTWMYHIALEYLSYVRRQEMLFGVSRYFLMNIFTRGDWKEAGRLDEKKIAQRLLKDEQLTVLQKYRIACVYCLHLHIPQLWKKLTQEEKQFTSGSGKRGRFEETNNLVLLWSYHMNKIKDEEVVWQKNHILWTLVAYQAVSFGNCAALMLCWKMLKEAKKIFIMALRSVRQWQIMPRDCYKVNLVSDDSPIDQSAAFIRDYNLPSYYNELTHFFLSQMDKEQQLTFFREAFEISYCDSVLECFLDWPHQDDFLPTINRLWGIIPLDKYGQCLLALAIKYSQNDEKENHYYDYRSLLRALWEETPKEYKEYLFWNRKTDKFGINEGEALLFQLLERSPFQEKDEALFKRIFRDQPQIKRREMMLSEWGKNSRMGENICMLLMQKEKWSFLNGLLEECLSKEEIPDFKKRFIQSKCGIKLCFDILEKNREKLVEDLLDWSLESDAEKTKSKDKVKEALINDNDCFHACKSLLHKGKFTDVDRVIHFCLSSDKKKEQFKVRLAQCAFSVLLECCVWKQMDTIIAWSVDTEKKRRDFKKDLFSRKRIDVHYELVFVQERWEEVERFYQWFGLSPEEIKQLKKDTLFTPQVFQYIHKDLPEYTNELVTSLRWCLTHEEMVIDLKKEIEKKYFTEVLDEGKKKEKERLDDLISELLDGFWKEVQDKTSREGTLVKNTGKKRTFIVTEEASSSPRKLYKLS